MIRKLRVKLVAIIMAFATVILACVMAAVLGLTRATLEHQSLDMMGHIALNPIRVPAPGEEFDGVRLAVATQGEAILQNELQNIFMN